MSTLSKFLLSLYRLYVALNVKSKIFGIDSTFSFVLF